MPISVGRLAARAARVFVQAVWRHGSPDLRHWMAQMVTGAFEQITYESLRNNGLLPDGIIDVGANRGNWSRTVRQIFPQVPIMMVEAQAGLEPELALAARELAPASHHMALLGASPGEERVFYEMGTGSSLLPENSDVERTEVRAITTTLDDLVSEFLPHAKSLFLKLDIQGAELMVLAGASKTLARCAAVQLEVALLAYNAGAPLHAEVVGFMAERGLLVTEVAGFSRPARQLVQVDLVFARAGSPLRPEWFEF